MISRPLLWFIALALLAILGISFWAGNYPARVTIINNSGADLTGLTLTSSAEHVTVAPVLNGSARTAQLRPGGKVTIRFGSTSWTSADDLTPGRSLVVYVFPDGRIEARPKLGALNR